MSEQTDPRREEIAANLAAVQARVDRACAESGRRTDEVTTIVVTKFFPLTDVRLLAELGVRDVGENRHQEAVEKSAAGSDLGLRWHFIGALQSNKAAAVAAYADVVHSVDRVKLVSGLSRGAVERGRALECLVQVSLDPAETASGGARSGCDLADLPDLAERILAAEGLHLRGVMGVAPLGGDPAEAFVRLAAAAELVGGLSAEATWMSAGMSGDLEHAVRAGATHLRIGSAVLGQRPPVK